RHVDIPPNRFAQIVDRDSRLIIKFRTDAMEKALAPINDKWKTYTDSFEYKDLQKKLREETNPELRQMIESLIAGRIEEILVGGYDITVTARIIPKTGDPFDVPVQNYTNVEKSEKKCEEAEQKASKVKSDNPTSEENKETNKTKTQPKICQQTTFTSI